MVDKIDKTEPVSPYYIDSTAGTKKDREENDQGQQKNSDEYSGSHAAPGWQRIYSEATNRKYLKIRREDIIRIWFRATMMQRGISLAEVDIETKDRRVIKSAHVILSAREEFWTLKRFHPGQDIPLNIIVKEPILEVSVPAPRTPVNSVVQAKAGIDSIAVNKKWDRNRVIRYALIGLAALLVIIFLLTR